MEEKPEDVLTELARGDEPWQETPIECTKVVGNLAVFFCLGTKNAPGMFARLEAAGWVFVTMIGTGSSYLFRKGS